MHSGCHFYFSNENSKIEEFDGGGINDCQLAVKATKTREPGGVIMTKHDCHIKSSLDWEFGGYLSKNRSLEILGSGVHELCIMQLYIAQYSTSVLL